MARAPQTIAHCASVLGESRLIGSGAASAAPRGRWGVDRRDRPASRARRARDEASFRDWTACDQSLDRRARD